jgi:hypothetical protein
MNSKNNQVKEYEVEAIVEAIFRTRIKAHSYEEARRIAEDMPLIDFGDDYNFGHMDISMVKEIKS